MLYILLVELSSKEKDLLEEIYEDLNKKMYRYALKELKDVSSAEDVVSSTYIKISKIISKLTDMDKEERYKYCFAMLKNNIYDYFKKTYKESAYDSSYFEYLKDDKESIEVEFIKIENLEILDEILYYLSPKERHFLYLRYTDDLLFSEIVKILNISTEAARKRNERIIKKLKKLYEEVEKNGKIINKT